MRLLVRSTVSLALLMLTAAPARAAHVAFMEGRPFAEVLKRAKAEKKPIMLDIVAEWCGPCKLMDRTTFADSRVVEWSGKTVIAARVDAEKGEGRKLSQRYAIRSFPTVVFLNADGNEIDRLLGAFRPDEFFSLGKDIVAGKGRLTEALAKLNQTWTAEQAATLVKALGQLNDLQRLRPLALRIVNEDPELSRGDTLEAFSTLVAVEDYNEKVSAESTDLLETFIKRMPNDSRANIFALILARELARRGDVAQVRKVVDATMKKAGEASPVGADLLTALGTAEKKAGRIDAAISAFRRSATATEALGAAPHVKALRQLELADALARGGKDVEARAALKAGLERAANDSAALTMGAKTSLLLKDSAQAVELARKAVTLSRGEDAAAQGALASSLIATGDEVGAQAALKRALEIDPDNAEYKKPLSAGKKKGGGKPS